MTADSILDKDMTQNPDDTLLMELDAKRLRATFAQFPSGIIGICAEVEHDLVGMACSSFTSVSIDPPLVSVCFDNNSSTWPRLRIANKLGISVLAESHDVAARRLASKQGDRFDGLTIQVTTEGAALIHDAAAWFEVSIESEVPAGDHMIAILRIHRHALGPTNGPLVYHGSQFRRLSLVTGP